MAFRTVLITGIGGFVGPHLARHLLRQGGIRLFGTLFDSEAAPAGIDARYCVADLRDPLALSKVVEEIRPDWIFHLAAQSSVKDSIDHPIETLQTNLIGTAHLLESVRAHVPDARVLLVSSAEVYGIVRESDLPLTENHPLQPASPYALSKAAQDLLGLQYFHTYGTQTLRIRAFNHIGPGQTDRFATASFAKQIALIEAGMQEPIIRVGNLDARRDITDVRDVVAGYHLALQSATPGQAYNLCSGHAVVMGEVLDRLLSLSNTPIRIEQDPTRLRPSDVPILLGDNTKLRTTTEWQPTIPLDQSLADILNAFRDASRQS